MKRLVSPKKATYGQQKQIKYQFMFDEGNSCITSSRKQILFRYSPFPIKLKLSLSKTWLIVHLYYFIVMGIKLGGVFIHKSLKWQYNYI